jgi:hypothetical protein
VHCVPFVFAHTPFFAPAAHEAPAPQLATPQQTPSVQKSGAPHELPSTQGSPRFAGAMHEPDLQMNPAAQSVAEAHVVLHESAPHENAPQLLGASPQLPAPSQVLACVSTPLVGSHAFLLHAG